MPAHYSQCRSFAHFVCQVFTAMFLQRNSTDGKAFLLSLFVAMGNSLFYGLYFRHLLPTMLHQMTELEKHLTLEQMSTLLVETTSPEVVSQQVHIITITLTNQSTSCKADL